MTSHTEAFGASFTQWFQRNNGYIDLDSLGFTIFPDSDGGRGLIALKDIPKDHVLFTIPRSLTLSTRTSELPLRFGTDPWKHRQLNQGWTGLILCMMWENANGAMSKWSEYLAILPNSFDTPMFWDEDDLKELVGTSAVEKLGREEAEDAYRNKLLPAVQSRLDLFPLDKAEHYSLMNYHLMGSRILSRSFNVEKWEPGEEEENTSNRHPDGMDVDTTHSLEGTRDSAESEAEEDDEDDESSDIAMVPMADMLNARYGSENAKLYDDENDLKMISTKPIKAGDQIWNTYGDLPNAELLRRYGHVDLLPLPKGGVGNPGDVIELRADVVASITTEKFALSSESLRARIDWWLEEGGDDVLVLETDLKLPDPLISLIHLLALNEQEWETAKGKGKPPKPILDDKVLEIVQNVLEARLKAYLTTLQEDEIMLSEGPTRNKRNAIIVRMGEKWILTDFLGKVYDLKSNSVGSNKRKEGNYEKTRPQKRARR